MENAVEKKNGENVHREEFDTDFFFLNSIYFKFTNNSI